MGTPPLGQQGGAHGGLCQAFSDAQTVIWLRMQYWQRHKLRGGAIPVTGHGVAFLFSSDFLSVGGFFVHWDFLWRLEFFFVGWDFFCWLGFFLSVEIFSAGWVFFCRLEFFLLVGIFFLGWNFFCRLGFFLPVGAFFISVDFFVGWNFLPSVG